MRLHWRRFRARRGSAVGAANHTLVAKTHAVLRELLMSDLTKKGSLSTEQLQSAGAKLAAKGEHSTAAHEWFALMLLRAPLAARAQHAADTHSHGGPMPESQLYRLIDFNDAFVSTALALRSDERNLLVTVGKQEIDRICSLAGVSTFSEEQYDAITRGLSREVAVYLGALSQGFQAQMTARTQDALGIDLTVTDPRNGKTLNIDCKTASAFRYRLQDLVREGRMDEREAKQADLDGYALETNGRDHEVVEVVILRIDANEMGDMNGFEFESSAPLGQRLRRLFALHAAPVSGV